VASVVHARLHDSPRRVKDAKDAHLHFVPLHTRNVCSAVAPWGKGAQKYFAKCGLNYSQPRNITDMWKWMLQQPSFQASDGSDHFMMIEPVAFTVPEVQGFVRS
jgi:hypothetical protein